MLSRPLPAAALALAAVTLACDSEAGLAPAPGSEDAGMTDSGPAAPVEARLLSVEPNRGGLSVSHDVVVLGQGLPTVIAVYVGGLPALSFQQVDDRAIEARFPPLGMKAGGMKLVSVVFADGTSLVLPNAFEYFFDEDPVVFVHGFSGGAWHWGVMLDRFRDAGYPDDKLWALSFEDAFGSSLPNVDQLAVYLADVLNQTGAGKVDMVIHSMGGLSSRLYIKGGGWAFVRDYVSIAGAHHGTYDAYLYWSEGAQEMRPPYACEGEALHDIQFKLNGCLTDTGREVKRDETPFGVEDGGGIAYHAIYSGQDEIVIPSESGCLNQKFRNDCSDPINEKVSWLGHGGILLEKGVFEKTLAHLRRRNPSRP